MHSPGRPSEVRYRGEIINAGTVRFGGVGKVDLVDDSGTVEVDGPPRVLFIQRLHVAVRVQVSVIGQLSAVVVIRAAL